MLVKCCHALQVANLYARVRLLESACTLCVHVRADSLELESQVVVSHHVGAETGKGLWKGSAHSSQSGHLQHSCLLFPKLGVKLAAQKAEVKKSPPNLRVTGLISSTFSENT